MLTPCYSKFNFSSIQHHYSIFQTSTNNDNVGWLLFIFFLSAITWETELFSWILRKGLLEVYYWVHTVPLYLLQPLESLFNKLSREDRNEMEQEATSPSLILVSKKDQRLHSMAHTVVHWHLTPPCNTGSSLSTSGELRAAPGAGSHLPVLPRLSRHPAPVTAENPARATFALTHTGNPWQPQELDPAYSSFSPELCDLWYCCNETCLGRSPLSGGEKLNLLYTSALTLKAPHSIF